MKTSAPAAVKPMYLLWIIAPVYRQTTIFDFNKDVVFKSNDKLEIEGELTAPAGLYVGRGQGSKPALYKDTLFITVTGEGVSDEGGGGDDDDDEEKVEEEKLNISAMNVRLENWRHK